MAGRGDPVSGVELLPFPKTRAGRRLEALVTVFQQAGGNGENKTFSDFLGLASDRVTAPLSVIARGNSQSQVFNLCLISSASQRL